MLGDGCFVLLLPVEILGQVGVSPTGVGMFFAQQFSPAIQHVLIEGLRLFVFALGIEAVGQQHFAEQRIAVFGTEDGLASLPSLAGQRLGRVVLRAVDIPLHGVGVGFVGFDQLGTLLVVEPGQQFRSASAIR